MAYATADIRNVALIGHAGSGKSKLAEALLARAGTAKAPDPDPLEKEHGHTLDATAMGCMADGKRIHLIDTPGYPDLLGRATAVLPAAESALIVVNAQSGIELATRRAMEAAAERKLCRVIVVNKIDVGGNLPALLEQLREAFGPEVKPINLPAGRGTQVRDCFFTRSGGSTDFSSVEEAHRSIIEQVVEVDEDLLGRYLEGDESVEAEHLHDAFERALREGHLIPVCFVSATTRAGVPELLDLIVKLLPNPTEANPPPFVKGEGDAAEAVAVAPDAGKHALAHVFKISVDPYAGRIAALRVHQGTLKTGQQLLVGNARKPFKVAHLFELQGRQLTEKGVAIPGDIVAITKIDDLHYDAVVHDSHDEDHHHLNEPKGPAAMLGLVLEAAKHGDEQKLADGLHKLTAEDPSLRVEHHPAQNETVLYGQGEFHLRIALERLKRAFNVEVKTRPPSVPFRETITRMAEGHHRHKKQTGGAGQFGEVYLRIEPLPRGSGFEFVDDVVGGAIPHQFIPAVEKGVRQVLDSGAVAGYPLQDVRVSVYDGKTHAVDGKEVAFISAGRKAFLDAITKAGGIILEPIVHLAIYAPVHSVGGVTGDLTSLRGRIGHQEALPGNQMLINATAPLAELEGYHHKLKAQTSGAGQYSMSFSHYDPAPPRLQQELAGAYAKRQRKEED